MKWISQVILDLIVLLAIGIFVFTHNQTLYFIIWGYTSLLILSRLLYYFVSFLRQKASTTQVPVWFYHLNYTLICLLLTFAASYYLLAAWILIWVMSSIPKK